MAEEVPEIAAAAEPAKPEPQAMAADMPLLRIEAVEKSFGTVRAVDRVSLDVAGRRVLRAAGAERLR